LSSPQAGDACTTTSFGDDIEIGPFEADATRVELGAAQAATPAAMLIAIAALRASEAMRKFDMVVTPFRVPDEARPPRPRQGANKVSPRLR
jgi:hypothetical protein